MKTRKNPWNHCDSKKKHGNLNARIKTLIPFAITLIGLIILLIIGVW